MTVLIRRIRSAISPVVRDDSWPRLLFFTLFWVSTALLATVLLIADPALGPFVVGIPLLLAVLVRERGLDGIPAVLFGAAIGSSLAFTLFFGQHREVFDAGAVIAGFAVFLVWVSTYPMMLRQMDRQHQRERARSRTATPGPMARLYVVRAWMSLLVAAVLGASIARDLVGT